ncbi:NAD(P)-dependent oxidoreductase [bacterium SCSIO 12741]|nr:NAD(P)-dependent oxidoreductase [bacterium SCSIO 12741]
MSSTLFITGSSRGIGKAIGLRFAREGWNVVITGKTTEPHPKLDGTIYTAAEEIEAAGGKALALELDIRSEEQVAEAMEKTASKFGGIDVLVNNASAINLSPTEILPMKRFDLMHQVNTRGTFMVSKYAIPLMSNSANPHILMLSPPLNMEEKWFAPHLGYSIAKFGMSLCVLGLAGELKSKGIGVNALWPVSTIDTAAVRNLLGGEELAQRSRKPDVVADSAFLIAQKKAAETTGNFFLDEEVLKEAGITDLSKYSVVPGSDLFPDFFV